jgi:hypothetical protein
MTAVVQSCPFFPATAEATCCMIWSRDSLLFDASASTLNLIDAPSWHAPARVARALVYADFADDAALSAFINTATLGTPAVEASANPRLPRPPETVTRAASSTALRRRLRFRPALATLNIVTQKPTIAAIAPSDPSGDEFPDAL